MFANHKGIQNPEYVKKKNVLRGFEVVSEGEVRGIPKGYNLNI